ncbi:SprT-like domain-containing protein [Lysinibacter sp. HNR]|uniref:SprT-like domain-containing protein n=1 Tax=Lysinibacter sp. HNR TaxID=3031408 RepID=UPI00243480DA|nr:SprT-like domain-containing protein [Lysinibacter sp. HNR]WGD36772.1 SprT-like domain-containing protein [Lysinibacter sp. HNR]
MAELSQVKKWAEALIALHLNPLEWSFAFDHAKRRAGACHYTQKKITVSRYLAAKYSDDEIHQILLHEIAHALAGHAAAHGPVWKKIAENIGYDGERLHDGESAHELAPYVGHCAAGHTHYRYRAPTRELSCGSCGSGFDVRYLITWETRRPGAA